MSEMTDFPVAPEGTGAAAFFASMAALGMTYAGSTHEGGRFTCPHPAHEDTRPSLDVTLGRNGKPLLNCKVCEVFEPDHDVWFREVRAAGVRVAGLPCESSDVDWGPRADLSRGHGGADDRERVNAKTTIYHYNHADGLPNFAVVRTDFEFVNEDGSRSPGKAIRARHYVAGRGFVWGLPPSVERTPLFYDRFERWSAPECGSAEPGVLYLVEGEKTAAALRRTKRSATSFHGGADARRPKDWVARFGIERFGEVRVWPDADEAGVVYAKGLLADLRAAGVKAVLWGATDVAPKDDAFDVIAAGRLEAAHALTRRETDALAGLVPRVRPAAPRKASSKPLVSAQPPKAAGEAVSKPLVSAAPPMPEPYTVAAGVTPYLFVDEMVLRHFTLSGVLTLRFHHDGDFWLWDRAASRYVRLSHAEVGALVSRLLDRATETTADGEVRELSLKPRLVGELVAALEHRTLTSDWGGGAMLPAVGGVPFLNGWLDVETGTLRPVGPERDVRWNVPLRYAPDGGPTPEWENFLSSIGWGKGSEEYRLLRQWFGYLLSGSTVQQKALVLVGPTRSGKTTIQHVAEAMLGDGAVGTELETLADKNGLENVIGKGLVTVGDVRFTAKTDKGLVSRLLTVIGGDTVTVNPKYKKLVSAKMDARIMMGSNEPPVFTEASDALARRLIFLQMTRSFLNNEDHELEKKLLGELSGIVTWSLEGYRDLLREGHFSQTTAGAAAQEQLALDSSPVRTFVTEMCEFGPGWSTAKDELYQEYELWCQKNGIKFPVQLSRFVTQLNTAFPGLVKPSRVRTDGQRVQLLVGIRLTK